VRISVWMRWKGDLEQRKIAFRVLNMNLDTTTPTGKLILNVLGSIAQFERELIKERMLVGIAKAKAEGKYKGGKPTTRATVSCKSPAIAAPAIAMAPRFCTH